jgi:phosphate transport system ATP-binding protein
MTTLAPAPARPTTTTGPKKVQVENLRTFYGKKEVHHGITFDIEPNEIFAIIGPAQSGKTTLLRAINRTLEFTPGARMTGSIKVDGQDIQSIGSAWRRFRARGADAQAPGTPATNGAPNSSFNSVYDLRRKIGMVAPLPVGLPLTIYDNVAFAPRSSGIKDKAFLDAHVEKCLRQAALWDEVKDRLDSLGTKLSGGQQQRLTIARALSHQPEILCLDEFSIAIDPVTTMRIEDVLKELKKEMTIILVTNLVQQARRLAARTMFLWNGDIIELDRNEVMFSDNTKDRRTYEYVNGIFG